MASSRRALTDQERIDEATLKITNPNVVGSGFIQHPPQRPFERPLQAQPLTVVGKEDLDDYSNQAFLGDRGPHQKTQGRPYREHRGGDQGHRGGDHGYRGGDNGYRSSEPGYRGGHDRRPGGRDRRYEGSHHSDRETWTPSQNGGEPNRGPAHGPNQRRGGPPGPSPHVPRNMGHPQGPGARGPPAPAPPTQAPAHRGPPPPQPTYSAPSHAPYQAPAHAPLGQLPRPAPQGPRPAAAPGAARGHAAPQGPRPHPHPPAPRAAPPRPAGPPQAPVAPPRQEAPLSNHFSKMSLANGGGRGADAPSTDGGDQPRKSRSQAKRLRKKLREGGAAA